jgi:hypothetical protein
LQYAGVALIATALGISVNWYRDVETHDDETTRGLSVGQLNLLAVGCHRASRLASEGHGKKSSANAISAPARMGT